MRIITDRIENEIKGDITRDIAGGRYASAADKLSAIVDRVRANIPESKRGSYGIVYSVKTVSELLFKHLVNLDMSAFEVASQIYVKGTNHRGRSVGLGILSYYGLRDLQRVLPYFESAASSSDWNLREISQMFFRKIIGEHPKQVRKYLVRLTKSDDGHLRRFVAETLRPVQENKWFFNDPAYPLSILRRLFKESFPDARTSVGNNLSDLAKRLPDLVYELVKELVDSGDKNSYWIAYRACRNLVKKEPTRVMNLLKVDEYKYKTRVHKRENLESE